MVKQVGLGALALLATAGVLTATRAPAAEPAASKNIVIKGTVKILVSVAASPSLPNGTVVSVSPTLRVGDTTSTNTLFVYASTTVSKGKVTYTITLPYNWSVASRSDLISVMLGLGGQSTSGSQSTYFTEYFAIPANGTTTTVHFVGSI